MLAIQAFQRGRQLTMEDDAPFVAYHEPQRRDVTLGRYGGRYCAGIWTVLQSMQMRGMMAVISLLSADARALVKVRLTSQSGDADRGLEATATHDAATNELFYAAWIDVGAGHRDLRVVVEHGGEAASVDVPWSIVPATKLLADYWRHLLLPPIAIVVLVLHQCLVESRRSPA